MRSSLLQQLVVALCHQSPHPDTVCITRLREQRNLFSDIIPATFAMVLLKPQGHAPELLVAGQANSPSITEMKLISIRKPIAHASAFSFVSSLSRIGDLASIYPSATPSRLAPSHS